MRRPEFFFTPPTATLRWFAALAALFLAGLAVQQFLVRDNRLLALVGFGFALVVGLVGLISPSTLRPVFVGWMVLVYPLNWLSSHLILAFIFCIFTPLGLFFRLIGRDVLARRFRREQDSYWTDKPGAADVRSYFRQS